MPPFETSSIHGSSAGFREGVDEMVSRMRVRFLFVIVLIFCVCTLHAARIGGDLMQWHRMSIDFDGPMSDEQGTPNPFVDFRLQVDFTGPGGQKFSVPGFFAADGKSEETGATQGTVWRVYFSPDATGKWSYKVSFRAGPKAAIAGSVTTTGNAVGEDGTAGEFQIAPSDKSGRDFRGKGRLRYVGRHHLQFSGTGEYFLKVGSDSPENLLGFADFDGTSKAGGGSLKSYTAHLKDWKEGDPSWKGGKGKGLIGALNYLSQKGLNAFSFLTFNSSGDGKDVWMWTGPSDHQRFDCSKLAQWEMVFAHADKLGLYQHFKTQETEVDQVLDGGNLGDNRKLYYRELIARFGHHLALNWNIGEENSQSAQQVKDCINYFREVDPYGHAIVIHTFPGDHDKYYGVLKGGASWLSGASIQTDWNNVYAATRKWREESAIAGRKWVVANDEQGSANTGVAADAGYAGDRGSVADNRDAIRQQTLWGNLMAGGAGVEYYFGYNTGETDLTLQDFRSRELKWNEARIAHEFFLKNKIPFWDMAPSGESSVGWTLSKPGEHYLVYLPSGGAPKVDLSGGKGRFQVSWFNPRTGSIDKESFVQGGSQVDLGQPPSGGDWAVWARSEQGVSVADRMGRRASPLEKDHQAGSAHLADGKSCAPGFPSKGRVKLFRSGRELKP